MRVSEFQRVTRLRTTSNHIMLHCNLDQRKKTAKTQRKMRIKEEEINFRIVFFCSFFYIWIYDSALTTTRKYQKEKKKIIHKIICHIKFIIMQKEGVRRIFSMCSLLLACVVHIKDLSYRVIFSWWLQLHIQMIRYFFFSFVLLSPSENTNVCFGWYAFHCNLLTGTACAIAFFHSQLSQSVFNSIYMCDLLQLINTQIHIMCQLTKSNHEKKYTKKERKR